MKQIIRIATKDDLHAIVKIFMEMFPKICKTQNEYEAHIMVRIDENAIYVLADQTNSIIGFYSFVIWANGEGKMFYFNDLAVATEHQGKGYSTLLFKHAKNFAKENDCEIFQLGVDADNSHAHNIYKHWELHELNTEMEYFVTDDKLPLIANVRRAEVNDIPKLMELLESADNSDGENILDTFHRPHYFHEVNLTRVVNEYAERMTSDIFQEDDMDVFVSVDDSNEPTGYYVSRFDTYNPYGHEPLPKTLGLACVFTTQEGWKNGSMDSLFAFAKQYAQESAAARIEVEIRPFRDSELAFVKQQGFKGYRYTMRCYL